MISFFVPMKPIGKGRPRVTKGGLHTYTPASTVKAEELIASKAMSAGVKPLTGPLELDVDAIFAVPKSWTKKQVQVMEANRHWQASRPDADNIGKIVADALNGIAYHDDCQICIMFVRKYYVYDCQSEGLKITIIHHSERFS